MTDCTEMKLTGWSRLPGFSLSLQNPFIGLFVRKRPETNVEDFAQHPSGVSLILKRLHIESSLLPSIHRFKSNQDKPDQRADRTERDRERDHATCPLCWGFRLVPDSQSSCSRALIALQCRAALFAAVTTGPADFLRGSCSVL